MENLFEQVQTMFEETKASIGGALGVKLNYAPASLIEIEKAIDRIYPIGSPPLMPLWVTVGFYYGETMIKYLNKQRKI